jgi:hypothetical protein
MTSITLALRAAHELGAGPLWHYANYQVALRSGWLRRLTPIYPWDERPLSYWLRSDIRVESEDYLAYRSAQPPPFFLNRDNDFVPALRKTLEGREAQVIDQATMILQGRFPLFGTSVDLGFPPDWKTFVPLERGSKVPSIDLGRHWSAYAGENFPADIKLLWEPARFGWVYPLARAYFLTGDELYFESLWTLVDSWRTANQPNAGPHWLSAQEVALRLMALAFIAYAFAPNLLHVPERMACLAQMIAVHAERIPPTMSYARAQANNHLLTEAVGLYTAGLLFPEFERAIGWRNHGRRWLIRALDQQVFSDGGYVQHSTNYQRLALQLGLWAVHLAEVNNDLLPNHSLEAMSLLAQCLAALVDQESGRVPNFGPNDGAHVLPLSSCSFEDFRPTVQAAWQTLFGRPLFNPGPWDEASLWLGLSGKKPMHGDQPDSPGAWLDTTKRESHPSSTRIASQAGTKSGESTTAAYRRAGYPHAGIYILHGRRTWGMLRCAHFCSRPGHSDQLHFDLWRHGQNLACDPGTYLYNGSPPWDNGLMGAEVHNTLMVDDQEPMRRGGRFLWLDWAQGRVLGRWSSAGGGLEILAAEHDGYRRMEVTCRRTVVRAGDDHWLVVDDVTGDGIHVARTGWLLPDVDWQLEARVLRLVLPEAAASIQFDENSGKAGLFRGGELVAGGKIGSGSPLWGWRSPGYAVKEPALRFIAEARGELPLRIVSWWCFDEAKPADLVVKWSTPGEGLASLDRLEYQGEHLETQHAYSVDPSGIRCTW